MLNIAAALDALPPQKEKSTMNVTWQTCGDDKHWCSLENLDLNSVRETGGVYIIWHEGNPGRVVRIGQGDIKDRLGKHQKDQKILAYRKSGKLRVTWAAVPSAQRDGVENYLAGKLNPLVGEAFPDCAPLAVNYPW
jgi:hypothetical protein